MKKLLSICLLLSLFLCLSACAPGGEPSAPATCTVTVLDSEGQPAAGVLVQLCKDGEACFIPKKTDASGQMTFTLEAGENIRDYHVTLSGLPEGQSAAAEYSFEAGKTALTIQLTK
ncbi:MAG: hypothetical protein J6D31_01030 [Clostridia bacterium]|nr:hypothetical protein [Clostridia bacterium]